MFFLVKISAQASIKKRKPMGKRFEVVLADLSKRKRNECLKG